MDFLEGVSRLFKRISVRFWILLLDPDSSNPRAQDDAWNITGVAAHGDFKGFKPLG